MNKEELKSFTQQFFKDYSLPAGEVSASARMSIRDGYDALFGDAEIPPANMVPECDGDINEYYRILLKCIQEGEPYRLPADVAEERKRLDKADAVYD